MVRVLDELRQDHRNMAMILAIVEGQSRLIREGRIADPEIVERAMDYSPGYPDLYHHPKEDVLFERIVRRDPTMRDRVERLMQEHRETAQLTRRFADAVRQVMLDFAVPRHRFVEVAEAYVAANRRHMQVEEGDIFPAAERLLGENDWTAIEAAIEQRTDPLLGGVLESRYHSLHNRILQLGG